MKTFIMWKLPVLASCFVAALILSPACKAQSEVAPDHFEDRNTEPFARPPARPVLDASATKSVAAQTPARSSVANQAKQLVAARDASVPAQQNAVITEKKRKTDTRKSPQQ